MTESIWSQVGGIDSEKTTTEHICQEMFDSDDYVRIVKDYLGIRLEDKGPYHTTYQISFCPYCGIKLE